MTLTATATALLGLVAWALLLIVLLVNQRGLLVLSGKMAVNAFNPDGSNTPSNFGQRLVRTHANCLENLPLQAALLLYAMASAQTDITEPLALLLLGARQVSLCALQASQRFGGVNLHQQITLLDAVAFGKA